jgi:hypothetical protein
LYAKKSLNEEHFTRIRNFRQQFSTCFLKRREALCGLVEAVKQTSHLNSFVELSLAPAFKHRWSSVYAITDAAIDTEKLNLLCLAQVPVRSSVYYALDVMNVRRATSETLEARMVCHGAKREAFGNGVILGLPYSILAFTENASSSWAMTVNNERVKPAEKACQVAVKQIEWLFENALPEVETSVGLDGGYGNISFFLGLRGKKAFAVARMRNDRTMYRRPERRLEGRGNQPKYGAKFKFDEPATWGEPEEVIEFEDEKHGQVRVEKWSQVRFRVAKEVVEIEVIRSQIHLERKKPPKPRWYGIHNGTGEPTELKRSYLTVKHRWTIEGANRFRKDRLYVEKPMFREATSSDQWMKISQILEWETYLWRALAIDERMPWQKPLSEEKLTPARVLKSLGMNLSEVGALTQEVLPRGNSGGWEKGRERSRPIKYKIKLKGKKKAKKVEKVE